MGRLTRSLVAVKRQLKPFDSPGDSRESQLGEQFVWPTGGSGFAVHFGDEGLA
jgi:hypothetical protein